MNIAARRATAVLACVGLGAGAQLIVDRGPATKTSTIGVATSDVNGSTIDTGPTGTTETTTTAVASTTTVFAPRSDVLVDPLSVGRPYGSVVPGVLTFRGNPTRSYYGTGPIPTATPSVLWQYPEPGNPMCGESSEYGNVRVWCGTGWTGQPAVFERDGRTWVVFGAYDHRIHFVDAATGVDIIPPFATDDLAKGNVTVDPDGYPLIYAGSRDNYLRVIAFDGEEPRELYRVQGRTDDRMHNDDWDAAPLVLNDHLLEGGENSWFYGIKLNRSYASDGSVAVAPVIAFRKAGWDQELLDDLANGLDPRRVSLEASVMVSGDTAWLNSSGGLLQGWDVSSLRTGVGDVTRTFRFWTGDDSDSTVVADDEGFLYVGVEVDRNTRRAQQMGQLLKVDPRNTTDDPVVWRIDINNGVDSGTWATPIVTADTVIWNSKPGRVYGIDRFTGEILWKLNVAAPVLSSPVLVDGVLLQADGGGVLHAYDLADPRAQPIELWQMNLGANIESTPTVWQGRIYIGTREGFVYCIGTPA